MRFPRRQVVRTNEGISLWVQSYIEAWEKAKQDGLEGVLMLKHRRSLPMPTVVDVKERLEFLPDFLKDPEAREKAKARIEGKTLLMHHLQLHKYLDEVSVKTSEAGEKKPKHNPKPSRMAFLDGLGRKTKY